MRVPHGENAVQQPVGQHLDGEAIGIGVALLDNLDVDSGSGNVNLGIDGLFHSESPFPSCGRSSE
jgi:hypothetical protein